MSAARTHYEQRIVRYLRDQDFVVEAGSAPGEYIVKAHRERPLPLRPRLSASNEILSEYIVAMSEHHRDAPEPVDDAMALLEINIEEELATVDLEGRNWATGLGVRRDSAGTVAFFVEREEPDDVESVDRSPDLVWQPHPSGQDQP